MALKLVKYDKRKLGGVFPTAEINLNPAAGRRLLRALREHEAVAAERADGNFIVISVEEGTVSGERFDRIALSAAPPRCNCTPTYY